MGTYDHEIKRLQKLVDAHNQSAAASAAIGHIEGVEHHSRMAKHHASKAEDLEWMDWERENNTIPRNEELHGSF
jgi:hypothetical protein